MSDRPKHDPHYNDLAGQYKSTTPVQVNVLEYYGGRDESPPSRVPKTLQFFLGLVMPIAYFIAAVAIQPRHRIDNPLLHLAVIVGIAALVRIRLRWKAFIPGVLTTVLVAPVAFFVICALTFHI